MVETRGFATLYGRQNSLENIKSRVPPISLLSLADGGDSGHFWLVGSWHHHILSHYLLEPCFAAAKKNEPNLRKKLRNTVIKNNCLFKQIFSVNQAWMFLCLSLVIFAILTNRCTQLCRQLAESQKSSYVDLICFVVCTIRQSPTV